MKVVHWELRKKFEFDHTNKWYMLNPESILKNDTQKPLKNFEIKTYHLIPATRPDLVIFNKRKETCQMVDFAVPAKHRLKLKEDEKINRYLDLAREQTKTMEHERDSDFNCN